MPPVLITRSPRSAFYDPSRTDIDKTYRKYIIQASTPNDTQLFLSQDQIRKLSSRSRIGDAWGFYKPLQGGYGEDTDIRFAELVTPNFDIVVEKIKICLHSKITSGCVMVNVWDKIDTDPTNLLALTTSTESHNITFTLSQDNYLISNALDIDENPSQSTIVTPYSYTIAANSRMRLGIQYANSDSYGLKVFIIGWANGCQVN